MKTGKLDPPKPVNACFLPQLVRVAVASQQHYGVSMTRGLAKPEGDVIPFDSASGRCADAESSRLEDALRANPAERPALVEEAAVFDREHLDANALAAYRKVAAAVERRRLGARPHFRTGRIARHAGGAESGRDLRPTRKPMR